MAKKEKLTLWQAAGLYLDATDAEREMEQAGRKRTKRYIDVKKWRKRAEADLRRTVKENG